MLNPRQRRLLYELCRGKTRSKRIHGYIFNRFYQRYLIRDALLATTLVLIIWLLVPLSWLIPIKVAAAAIVVSGFAYAATCCVLNSRRTADDYYDVMNRIIDWNVVEQLLRNQDDGHSCQRGKDDANLGGCRRVSR